MCHSPPHVPASSKSYHSSHPHGHLFVPSYCGAPYIHKSPRQHNAASKQCCDLIRDIPDTVLCEDRRQCGERLPGTADLRCVQGRSVFTGRVELHSMLDLEHDRHPITSTDHVAQCHESAIRRLGVTPFFLQDLCHPLSTQAVRPWCRERTCKTITRCDDRM